eukprot:12913727-Prorocentrum_lima.AAC.1
MAMLREIYLNNTGLVANVNSEAISGALKTLLKKEANTLVKLDTSRKIHACDYKIKHPEFRNYYESRSTSLERF